MTLYIVLFTSLISLWAFYEANIKSKLIFHPYSIKHRNEWYRFFTSGVLHADFLHLAVNMFVLYSFGQAVESYYHFAYGPLKGTVLYVILYITAIAASSVSTYQKYHEDPSYSSLGASGAVSAVLFASIIFEPYAKIYFYGIIGIPGILAGAGYLVYSYYMSKKQGDNINHEAHLYGAIYGLLFTIIFKPALALYFVKELLRLA